MDSITSNVGTHSFEDLDLDSKWGEVHSRHSHPESLAGSQSSTLRWTTRESFSRDEHTSGDAGGLTQVPRQRTIDSESASSEDIELSPDCRCEHTSGHRSVHSEQSQTSYGARYQPADSHQGGNTIMTYLVADTPPSCDQPTSWTGTAPYSATAPDTGSGLAQPWQRAVEAGPGLEAPMTPVRRGGVGDGPATKSAAEDTSCCPEFHNEDCADICGKLLCCCCFPGF
jgi:hypothetical protein